MTAPRNEPQASEPLGGVPVKAEFFVAPYEGCGTPRVTVRYDARPGPCEDSIWVETGYGTNWLAFEHDIADEVCAAIQAAASAIRARLPAAAVAAIEGEKA